MKKNWKTTLIGIVKGTASIIAGIVSGNTLLIGTGVLDIIQGIATKDYDSK